MVAKQLGVLAILYVIILGKSARVGNLEVVSKSDSQIE